MHQLAVGPGRTSRPDRTTASLVGWPGGGRPHFASVVAGRVAHVSDESSTVTGRRRPMDASTTLDDAQEAIDEARRRLAEVPAEVVVTNHVMGLYELAAIHLGADPPDLPSAALAIDAVACLVEGSATASAPTRRRCATPSPTSASPSSQIKAARRRLGRPRPADGVNRPMRRRRCTVGRRRARRRPRRAAAAACSRSWPGTSRPSTCARPATTARRSSVVAEQRADDARPARDSRRPRRCRRSVTTSPSPERQRSRRRFAAMSLTVVTRGRCSPLRTRPSLAQQRRTRPSAPTAIVRVPSAISTQWNGNARAVVAGDLAEPDALVELGDDRAAVIGIVNGRSC